MNQLKEDTEQKIIKAAREVFIEKGLQGARMQEIADKAGINKALLHYYFRSKDKMFDAVFQDIIREIVPVFSEKMKGEQNINELLRVFIGFYNDTFRKNPYLPQFFFHEIWQHPDKLAAFIKAQDINPEKLMKANIDKLPKSDDTPFFVQHMFANVLGMTLFPHIARPLFQRILFDNNEELYDKFLSERTNILMKLIEGSFDSNKADMDEAPDEDF